MPRNKGPGRARGWPALAIHATPRAVCDSGSQWQPAVSGCVQTVRPAGRLRAAWSPDPGDQTQEIYLCMFLWAGQVEVGESRRAVAW